jgi:hypothetical protein
MTGFVSAYRPNLLNQPYQENSENASLESLKVDPWGLSICNLGRDHTQTWPPLDLVRDVSGTNAGEFSQPVRAAQEL